MPFAVMLAGLTLAFSACGGDDESGPVALSGAIDPADYVEFRPSTVRIGGIAPADVATAALLAGYPTGSEPPSAWFLLRDDRWQEAALTAPFAARPVKGALLPVEKDFIPTASGDALARLKVKSYPQAKGLETLVMGKVGSDVFLDLTERELKSTQLTAPDPYALAEKFVPFQGGGAGKFSSSIVVAPSEQRDYALPAAAWSAYSGDTLVLVDRNRVPPATARVLAQREKLLLEKPTIYVIGPESVISSGVAAQMAAYGPVKRIAGPSAPETAVALARYHDPATQFGWNMKKAPASVSLVNSSDWANAIGAWTFAAVGPQAPLLLTPGSDSLPPAVLDYLEKLGRGGGRNHAFVFGDKDSISSATMAEVDRALGGGG
jgi:hypothetical protein